MLDPTLLIDRNKWDEVKKLKKIDKKYVFCYFIGSNIESRKVVEKFANKYKLEVVVLPHIDEFVEYDEKYGTIFPGNVGPGEFIDLISNAEFVFTDSFHATVFSIIYEKNFFVFERFNCNDKKSTNTRIYSLLSKINENGRLCRDIHDVENNKNSKIDYSEVNKILANERKKSIDFLNNAIK